MGDDVSDGRLEQALQHQKLFSADAREGRSRSVIGGLLVMGAVGFLAAFALWFGYLVDYGPAQATAAVTDPAVGAVVRRDLGQVPQPKADPVLGAAVRRSPVFVTGCFKSETRCSCVGLQGEPVVVAGDVCRDIARGGSHRAP